jgi:hypothetical protein
MARMADGLAGLVAHSDCSLNIGSVSLKQGKFPQMQRKSREFAVLDLPQGEF